jgi:hypothetical protein
MITILKLDECMLVDDKALLFVSATLTELTELSLNNCPQVRPTLRTAYQRRRRVQVLSMEYTAGYFGFGRGDRRQLCSAALPSP